MFKSYCLLIYFIFLIHVKCASRLHVEQIRKEIQNDFAACSHSKPSRGHQNRRVKREQQAYSEQFSLFRSFESFTVSSYDVEKWINKTRYEFTIELTLTAEGGQSTESLFGIFDRCQPDRHPTIEVRFESEDESEKQENRLTVRLKSSMSNEIHRLRLYKALRLYRTERIQITFDGNSLRVYKNGALERLMFEVFSIPLFSETESKCKIVRMFPNHFHGWIHSVRIWSKSLSHRELQMQSKPDYNIEFAPADQEDESEVEVPFCGVTVCDNPVVLNNYVINVERRKQKVLRYRVVVISENDGSNPTITDEQIELQHRELVAAFSRYNITWQLHIERMNNSNLRHKMIVFGCDQESSNGNCDSDCRGFSFGNDECNNTLICPVESIKNGLCDPECNTEQNHWDGGDCCQEEENHRCFDPKSKYRRYLEAAEYKSLVNLDNMNMLTVYVANWTNDGLIGLSTFPFEQKIFGVQGGILIHASKFGIQKHTHNLIHEIGHVLGLYHTHHGVDEMDCFNPCYEFKPSLLTGDLLEDTLPTSKQTSCSNSNDVCQANIDSFNNPVHNYMSYRFGCVNEFSAQQVARMHCYVDLKYINKWSENVVHSFPTNPWISIEQFGRTSSLKLHWPKPIDRESCRPLNAQADDLHCSIDSRIVQYAYKARANNSFEFGGRWNAKQATGGPDADLCSPSTKAWLPDVESCDEKDSCVIELWPDIKTTVEFLYVWIAWNAVDGVRSIDIDLTNGSTIGIKNIHVQCDSPFARRVDIDTPIEKIRIRTDNPFVSVDAVKFVSHKNDKNCAHCIRFHYEIERQPPFKDNKLQYTTKNTFIDWSSAIDQMYNYTVHLVGNDGTRYHSIQTVYEAAKKRCGDGVLDEETEECDDGNANELDGCSQFCRLDLGYLCNGSLCSRTDALDTNNSLVLVKATDYRLISDGEFVCQLNEMSQPAAIAQCESYDQLSDCYEMTAKMNSTIEAEFELVHPKALFVAFAPLPSKHQNNDSIDLELTTANNVKFKVDGLSLQSCTQSPLIIPIPNMSDNHDFISRLRLSVPTNYGIITIGLLVDSVYYSKAVQQCLQISNPFISTTKSNCMYSAKSSTLLSCGDVPLNEHANVNCFNDICRIKCKSGLQMPNELKLELRCTPNGWIGLKTFDLISHFCVPVDCGQPLTIPSMNIDCLNGHSLGAKCEAKCQPNSLSYPVYRQSSSIECLRSGVWSAPELICIGACSVDEIDDWNVNRTSLICHSELNHLFGQSNSEYWPIGSVCFGRCKLRYHLETNQSQNTLLRCLNASNWSGSKCERRHCPLTSTYYQALDCTDGAYVGSECRFNCSTEMGKRIRSIFCLPNARWSQRFACPLKPKDYCEIPTMPTNLVIKCPKYVAFGTNCSIECRSKGYDVVVETHRPQFEFQQITNLTCNSNGQLVPHFANLKCLRSCNEEFFGDGWCDFQNNRQYCHFDGGDCCNSTVSTRRVRLMFPMLCTHHLCQCIDPMAVENRGLRLLDPNEGLWFGRRLRSTRHIDAGHQDVSSANPSIQIARNVELIALQSPRTNNHFGLFTRLHENWRQRSSKAEMHENNFMTND